MTIYLRWRNRRLGKPLSDHELDDAGQDCLVDLWRKLPEYSGACSLETWARGFAGKQMLRVLHRGASPQTQASLDEWVADSDGPWIAKLQASDAVDRALARLEGDDAEIISRKHFQTQTFDEISADLGMPASSVKSRYYRALERLRASLAVFWRDHTS